MLCYNVCKLGLVEEKCNYCIEKLLIYAIPVLTFFFTHCQSGRLLNCVVMQNLVSVLVPQRCWDILLHETECQK